MAAAGRPSETHPLLTLAAPGLKMKAAHGFAQMELKEVARA
jgi:hypothetical protein